MIINIDRKTHTWGGICISIIYISQSVQRHFCVYFQGWPFGLDVVLPGENWLNLLSVFLSCPRFFVQRWCFVGFPLPTSACSLLSSLRSHLVSHVGESSWMCFLKSLEDSLTANSLIPWFTQSFWVHNFCSLFHRSFMPGNFAHLWFCFVPFPVVWLVLPTFLCQWRNAKYLQSPILNSVLTNVVGNQDIYKRIIPYGAQNWGFCPSKL